MCRRFVVRSKPEEVAKHFGATLVDEFTSGKIFSPQDMIPMIIDSRKNKQRELQTARFGIIPSFAMDPSVGKKMYNSRAETIDIKPSFRPAFEARRCLIPASSFFEWHLHNKEPHMVKPEKGKLMAFAGIWDRWRDPISNEIIVSCSIVTTDAAGPLSAIHQRMPAILDKKSQDIWLNSKSNSDELKVLLRPTGEILIEQSHEAMAA